MADENLDMFGNPIESSTSPELDMFDNPIDKTIVIPEEATAEEVEKMLLEIATQGYASPTSDEGPVMKATIE